MRNGQFSVFALIAALVIGAAAAVIALSMGVLDASEFPESRAVEIARGHADAVNRQSAVVNCGVHPQARRIVCMVAEGIAAQSAERFGDGLERLAH